MMRQEREQDLRTVGASHPAVYWCALVANAALGVWLVALPLDLVPGPNENSLARTPGAVACVAAGVLWLTVTASFHAHYLRRPVDRPGAVTVGEADGEPAVVLAWRTTFHRQPLYAAAVTVLLAVLLALVLRSGGTQVWWASLVVVLPVLLLVPNALLRLQRTPRLVLTPDGVGVDGLDGDAWLDWADVRDVEVEHVEQWAVVRIRGAARSPSWRSRAHRRLFGAARPGTPCLEVPGPAFPVDPRPVLAAVELYRAVPAARAELSGDAGRRRVLGELPDGGATRS
jgi:hypothetical protein